MTPEEFESWIDFYRNEPFDDRHRYHRPAALVAHASGGATLDNLLKFLQPLAVETDEVVYPGYSAADIATFKAFNVKPPRLKLVNSEGN